MGKTIRARMVGVVRKAVAVDKKWNEKQRTGTSCSSAEASHCWLSKSSEREKSGSGLRLRGQTIMDEASSIVDAECFESNDVFRIEKQKDEGGRKGNEGMMALLILVEDLEKPMESIVTGCPRRCSNPSSWYPAS